MTRGGLRAERGTKAPSSIATLLSIDSHLFTVKCDSKLTTNILTSTELLRFKWHGVNKYFTTATLTLVISRAVLAFILKRLAVTSVPMRGSAVIGRFSSPRFASESEKCQQVCEATGQI